MGGEPQAESRAEESAREGSSPHRTANAFIAVFLLYQVAMPLSYYLGGGGYDERFSWRMFSTLRLQRCNVAVAERAQGEAGSLRQVSLGQELQVAWINMLKRYRSDVVEKFMSHRCKGEDVSEVHYTRQCFDTDGTRLPPRRLVMDCEKRVVRELEEAP